MNRSFVALFLLTVYLRPVSAPAAEEVSRFWRAAAAAEVVLAGSLIFPVNEIRSDITVHRRAYVDVDISTGSVLKGAFTGSDVLKYFIGDEPWNVSSEELIALNGKEAILFLVHGPGGIYFPNIGSEALQSGSPSSLAELRKEIARQEYVSRSWRPHPESPHYRDIKLLIERLLNPATQDDAVQDLAVLAPDATLAIIDLMDDRRRLGVRRMTLRNESPTAFEGLAHYAPETVVDVCVGILNRSTGAFFFPALVNGGSEAERQMAVAAWRVYADIVRSHPAEVMKPSK